MSQQMCEQPFQFFPQVLHVRMQNKRVLKTAKRQRGLMEMWVAVPKKSKLGIFYVVYKCVLIYNSNNTPLET